MADEMTPGQSSYLARRVSYWRRHGMGAGDPLPWNERWEGLTDAQRADEENGALAAVATWEENHRGEMP